MANKFHVNKAGNPGPCSAQAGGCPFGGEDSHYTSPEAARAAYEKNQAEELLPKPKMKIGELNKLAIAATKPEEFDSILAGGSKSTFKALAKNPAAPAEVLLKAYQSTEDPTTREALEFSRNFPVSEQTPERFAKRVDRFINSEERDQLLTSDAIDYPKYLQVKALGRPLQAEKILESSNQLTDQQVVAEAGNSYSALRATLRGGRYPEAALKSGSVEAQHDAALMGHPKYSEALAKEAVAQQSKVLAKAIVSNPKATPEALRALAEADLHKAEAYAHPNANAAVKSTFEGSGGSADKLAKLNKEYDGDLANELVEVSDHDHKRHGAQVDTYRLDKELIEKHQLTEDDLVELFAPTSVKGGHSYDAASGTLKFTNSGR